MEALKHTPLNRIHKELKARMVPFAGWEMPVQYSGLIEEHMAVRQAAGLFDVSHMGEIEITGDDALSFTNYICTNNVVKMQDGQLLYSLLCHENGGIVDDMIVYRMNSTHFLLVVNASNTENAYNWILENKKGSVTISNSSSRFSQLALQGPLSDTILSTLSDYDISSLENFHFATEKIAGVECMLSRSGYTGEAGFELYFDNAGAETLWNSLMEAGIESGLKPVGLGARDTLRLEMGFSLYGHEIKSSVNPYEAGLGWVVKLKKGDFIGRQALLHIKEEGPRRKLVSLISTNRRAARQGYKILNSHSKEIGEITSGTLSPVLKHPIAMGLVDAAFAREPEFLVDIRGKGIPYQRCTRPFIKK